MNRRRLRTCLSLVALLVSIASIVSQPAAAQVAPLTPEQIRQLLALGTPDETIATEIRARGLSIVPTRDLLADWRAAGAGPLTLDAADSLRPLLDDAKQQIPPLLRALVEALEQGNAAALRPHVRPALASDARKLDMLCRPFARCAQYVERIVELPGREIQVIGRVFQQVPVTERVLRYRFGWNGRSFVLEDVTDGLRGSPDVFDADRQEAFDIVRTLVFAAKAGRRDVIAPLLSPGLDAERMFAGKMALAWPVEQILSEREHVSLQNDRGLKIVVRVVTGGTCCTPNGTFWLDRIDGRLRVVRWTWRHNISSFDTAEAEAEDPALLRYTLARFGIE